MKPAKENLGFFRLVSMSSGLTLAACGVGSLMLSVIFPSGVGLAISVALIVHAWIELRARSRFLNDGPARWATQMGWNQIALAGSISLYVIWQYLQIDPAAFASLAHREDVRSLVDLYGISVDSLLEEVPRFVGMFYGLLGIAAWLGCYFTARLYWKAAARRRLWEITDPPAF